MSKLTIQKNGEKDKIIDLAPIEEMRSRLEQKLINDPIYISDAEIINEAYELYKKLTPDQHPYYVNMILGVLHNASGMYKWATKNPEKVIETRDFFKILETYKKEHPEFTETQKALEKFRKDKENMGFEKKEYNIKHPFTTQN